MIPTIEVVVYTFFDENEIIIMNTCNIFSYVIVTPYRNKL